METAPSRWEITGISGIKMDNTCCFHLQLFKSGGSKTQDLWCGFLQEGGEAKQGRRQCDIIESVPTSTCTICLCSFCLQLHTQSQAASQNISTLFTYPLLQSRSPGAWPPPPAPSPQKKHNKKATAVGKKSFSLEETLNRTNRDVQHTCKYISSNSDVNPVSFV